MPRKIPCIRPEIENGRVTRALLQRTPHGPLESVPAVQAIAGVGLAGDCHAQPLGPRQLLVVREEALDELGADAGQLRANLVVRGVPAADLVSGAVLAVGGDARLRLTHQCEICSVLRRDLNGPVHRGLPGRRGTLGVVLDGGAIRAGDPVTVEPSRYPAVPDGLSERVAWVLARIPPGRVATYRILLAAVGGHNAHLRVLPVYLRRAERAGLPAHRVLTSGGRLTGHVDGQGDALAGEGVRVADGRLADPARLWDGGALYRSAT